MTSFAQRLLLATCVAALGCGDDATSEDHDNHLDGGVTADSSSADAGDDDLLNDNVPCDPATYPSFTPGMSVKAGALTVKLQSVDPAPPRQLTKNTWQLQILDASGQPASGLTFANTQSFMPVHNHGGRKKPVGTPGTEPGTYQLDNIDFIMRGPWQVIFDVQQNGSSTGTATIQICVE